MVMSNFHRMDPNFFLDMEVVKAFGKAVSKVEKSLRATSLGTYALAVNNLRNIGARLPRCGSLLSEPDYKLTTEAATKGHIANLLMLVNRLLDESEMRHPNTVRQKYLLNRIFENAKSLPRSRNDLIPETHEEDLVNRIRNMD